MSREEQHEKDDEDNDTPIVNDNHDPQENSKDKDKNNKSNNKKKKVRLATMKGQIISTTQEEAQARSAHHLFARKAVEWLSIREFSSTTECLQELRATQHTVWATDLSQEAVCQRLPIWFAAVVQVVVSTTHPQQCRPAAACVSPENWPLSLVPRPLVARGKC